MVRWAGPLLIAVAGAAMLHWSWLKWPDPLVDFGRELYIPWQLTEGKTLYKDIAYFNGPLSPYVNSVWFRLFGVSVRTLVVCNLVVAAGLVCLLYRILSAISNRLSATVACLIFVLVPAFGQLGQVGNYNFLCPYSHEMTHGLVISVLAIFFLSMVQRRRGRLAAAGAGFALGMVFLTKAEVFAAAALAMAVGIGLTLWAQRPDARRSVGFLALFAGSAVLPVVLAFAFLRSAMPADQAWRGIVGSWPAAFNPDIASLKFYRVCMGLRDPGASLKEILGWTGWYALVFLPAAGLALALRKPGLYRVGIAAAVFAVLALLLGRYEISWPKAVRPLPLVMLASGLAAFVAFFRHRLDPQASRRAVLQITVVVLATTLLAKMVLNVRLSHYGFVLAMPATLVLVVVLLDWVPVLLDRLGGCGGVFRAAGLAVLAVGVCGNLKIIKTRFDPKIHPIAQGADTFLTDRPAVAKALYVIGRQLRPDQTLVVLPEGVMLNYLARRANPTPYVNFMPPELIIFGEDRILESFRTHPPDYIALAHKNTAEYGYRFFGRHYGQRLFAWVLNNYHRVHLVGYPPLVNKRFGIELLKRNR